MNQPAKIKRQLQAVEETLQCLDDAKEALRVDSNSMHMGSLYVRNKAKLMKKYNLKLYDSLLLTAGTLDNIVDAGKESIKAIEFICNLLEKDKKELKERLTK